jgi:hypothetical protein
MTENQKNKILNIMCETLIPAIVKAQCSNFYPYPFTYNHRDDSFYLYINQNSMTDNLHKDLQNLSKMPLRSNCQRCLGDSPSIIKSLAMSMIDFLKAAEKHQKEIEDIIQFAEHIPSSNSRIVLIEKMILSNG